MRNIWKAALLSSVACAFAAPIQASAQETAPAQPAAQTATDTGDIIVTARRTEERLQDVPISITVFNQQDLANRNVVNAEDLAVFTPSLSVNNNFGAENATFALRGFAQDTGTEPSVGVYFADVIAPRGASNGLPAGDGVLPGQFFDLANVQVLKGPQGTLFGRNTTGGAVLLVPQKPTSELGGYVEGSIGNFDMRRIQAVANIPLADSFRVRLGIDHMVRDGFYNNTSGVGPKDFGNVNYWAGRLSIDGDLTPNLENYIIFSYNQSDTHGPINKIVAADAGQGLGFLAAAQSAANPGATGFYDVQQTLANPSSNIQQWQVINTTTWTASDSLTIKNIVSYSEYKQYTNAPLFGTAFPINFGAINPLLAGVGSYVFPFAQITPPPGLDTAHENTFTEELQFQGHGLGGKLSWQAGAYLESSQPMGQVGSQSPFLAACTDNGANFQCSDPVGFLSNLNPLIPPGTPPIHVGTVNYTVGTTSYHDVGLYAQGTYSLSSQFKVTGGFRYTWDRENNISDTRTYVLQYPPLTGLFPPAGSPGGVNPRCTFTPAITNCVANLKENSSAPTWMVDLEYTPTPDIMAYAKYARGYRAGTIAPNLPAPLNQIEQEKVDTYELGLKTSFHGLVRGTFNIAAFYNDFTNQQLQVGFNANPTSGLSSTAGPVNSPKSEIYGVEVDARVTPVHGLDLTLGYTYLHTKIISTPDFPALQAQLPPATFDLAGSFVPGDEEVLSPKHKLTAGANYTLPLDPSVGKISIGGVVTYRSSMLSNYIDRGNPNPVLAALSTLPALTIVDLHATWQNVAGSPVDASFFVSNLTNEKYYTFTAGLGSSQLGFETASLGAPRMFGGSLKIHFGH